MGLEIYKKGQGYWTRVMSAVALTALILMGAAWTWDKLDAVRIGAIEPVYVASAGAVIFIAVFALIGYYLIGRKPRVVDFMIATEGEMKKVNWSSRREIMGSTWVVIGLTVFIALLCMIFDISFAAIFRGIGVLETTD